MDAFYNGSNSFRVFNNLTSEFVFGRRVKMDCGSNGVKYASVVSSSYVAPYTTVVIDESDLTTSLTDVWYSVVTAGASGSIPIHSHDGSEGQGGTISGTGVGDSAIIWNDMEEPTGFTKYKNGSTLSFTGTEVTISGIYDYYIKGTKYSKSGADSVNVDDNSEGSQYVYFDGDSLTSSTAWSNDLLSDYSYVAELYWDDTNNQIIHLGDERHGIRMDNATHLNLHLAEGTRYISGLALVDMSVDGDGSSDTHAQFGASSGVILDEDLQHDIPAVSVGSTITVFYRNGASGYWRKDTQTGFAFLNGASYPKYNLYSAGNWTQPEVPNGDYVLYHIFATNDIDNPIISIMGQATYDGNTAARAGANEELNNLILSGLPFAEFSAIATIIIGAYSLYTNSVKAIIVSTDDSADYVDWRRSKLNPVAGNINDHGDLSGLTDDDHTQYLLVNGNRQLSDDWDFGSSNISGTGDIYCNDIYTSSGTVYIGDLKLSTDGQNLLVNDTAISGSGGGTSDVQSFTDLDDTPSTYSGTDGQYIISTGSGIDFAGPAETYPSNFSAYEKIGSWSFDSETVSLDVDLDGEDGPIYIIMNGPMNSNVVNMTINSDTGTNYSRGYVYQSGSTPLASATTDSNNFTVYGGADGSLCQTIILFGKKNGEFRHVIKHSGIYLSADTDRLMSAEGLYWSNTIDEITSLQFTSSSSVTFELQIYQFKPVNLPMTTSAEGNWILVATIEADDETISESIPWDGNTNPRIRIESFGASASASVYMRPNGDSGAAYRRGNIRQDGGSAQATWSSTETGVAVIPTSVDSFNLIDGYLKNTGTRRFFIAENVRYDIGNTDRINFRYAYHWPNTGDDVTSITITSDGSNATGEIKVYRWRDITDIPVVKGKQSMQVEYATTSGIYINPGEIHMKDSTFGMYELSDRIEFDVPGYPLAADTWYYIYTNVSGSTGALDASNFTVSSGSPTIDYQNMGYYNDDNRCIGVLRSWHNGDVMGFGTYRGEWLINSGDNISSTTYTGIAEAPGSWDTITLPLPFGDVSALASVTTNDNGDIGEDPYGSCMYRAKGFGNGAQGLYLGHIGNSIDRSVSYVSLPTNSGTQGEISWQGTADGAEIWVSVLGFTLPDYIYTGA